jgi:hypothetical protein
MANAAKIRQWLVRKLRPHEDPTHSFIPGVLDVLSNAIAQDFSGLQAAAGEANPAWPEGWAEAQQARGRGWTPPPQTRKDAMVSAIINDSFCRAYVDAALWENDESDESGGKPLNETYGIDGFTIEGLERILANCEAFQELPGVDDAIGSEYDLAGYHLWMTTTGAGVGFWDGRWSPEAEEVLVAAAEQFDGLSVYVGDNGKLYFGEI